MTLFLVINFVDVYVICSTLSGVNCGQFCIFALFQVLIADSFGILAHLHVLIAENFWYFGTLSGVN